MIPPYIRAGDPIDREYFIDVVDERLRQPIDKIQRDLLNLGFSPLFVRKYAKLRWELVDGLPLSTAERVN